jgi:hypothetical protein
LRLDASKLWKMGNMACDYGELSDIVTSLFSSTPH